jgi:hypothetical protein
MPSVFGTSELTVYQDIQQIWNFERPKKLVISDYSICSFAVLQVLSIIAVPLRIKNNL